ncbi:hypothetical protein [Yinghuangia seranimata]|uniref:hypothetical protein n=1 Tax=Yinghuangia seranimata TaxID=408067 RepID=UPI00248B3C87|nr:hypothetical protein [Yinghuangia seranimata]MDI2132768.1 hypothetical protein [Yinghuangia seranimata]
MERRRGANEHNSAAAATEPAGQWWHDPALEEPAFGTPAQPGGVPHPTKPGGSATAPGGTRGFDVRAWVFAPRYGGAPGVFAYGRDEAALKLKALDERARRRPEGALVRRAVLWLVLSLVAFRWFVILYSWLVINAVPEWMWPLFASGFWFAYVGFFGYCGRWHQLVFPYVAPLFQRLDQRAEHNGRARPEQWRRAGVALATGVVLWVMLQRPFVWLLLQLMPDERHLLHQLQWLIRIVYNVAFLAAAAYWGQWAAVVRPYLNAPARAETDDPEHEAEPVDEDLWPELRGAGLDPAAERLDEEAALGRLGDVDYLRLRRVLEAVDGEHDYLAEVAREVSERGAGACVHGSGARDVRPRGSVHDLMTGQVKVGRAADSERNTAPLRAVGFALDPDVLATSMVVVGPSAGETEALLRPVVESLSLSALAGAASVVVLDAKGGAYARSGAYDIEIVLGDPASPWGLDPYGAANGAEEAADRLATAALGDSDDEARLRDAARDALQQAIAAHIAAFGHYPSFAVLLDLLDGHAEALDRLRAALAEAGREGEFERGLRTLARADDAARLLVQRLSILERPGVASLFDPERDRFAMRHIDRPVRVRVALNEAAYPDAARIVGRLLIGQFVQTVAGRDAADAADGVFACLVADGAGTYLDEYAAQGMAWSRSRNAGLLLAVRSMDDFAPRLRAAVFGTVGCKAVVPGAGPRDAEAFAEHWGKTTVEEREVTRGAPDGGMVRKARFAVMGALFGEKAAGGSESVTVRSVERYRWSPSEITQDLKSRTALCSLTNRAGERTGPVLVELDS